MHHFIYLNLHNQNKNTAQVRHSSVNQWQISLLLTYLIEL